MVATALPLIRQHAFEAHLSRTLRSIDAEGLIDARTGLLTPAAFERDFASAVYQTQQRGGGLSVARFAFDPAASPRPVRRRAHHQPADAADGFRRRFDDGSVVVAFAETDLKTAHTIARRLSSVMRHTSHGKRDTRAEPTVTVATLESKDSAKSLLARLAKRRIAPRRDRSVIASEHLRPHCDYNLTGGR